MNVVSRAGDRPESVQSLFSAIDSCSYPSISIDDLSSSTSNEDRLEIKPRNGESNREEKCLSPSDFVCPSPVMSQGSLEQEDAGDRTSQGEELRTEGALRDVLDDCPNVDMGSSSSSSNNRLGEGLNGQHRTVSQISSDSEEEPGLSRSKTHSNLKRTHGEEGESTSSEKKLKT